MSDNAAHLCPSCSQICDCRDGQMDEGNCLHDCPEIKRDPLNQPEDGE